MDTLYVDNTAIGEMTWSRFSLDPAYMPTADSRLSLKRSAASFSVLRLSAAHASGQHQLWPALQTICFSG